MTWIKGLVARARSVLAPRASESRMEEEFAFHVEMETRRLERAGVPTEDARRRALVAFGGMETHRESMRDGRGTRWLHDVVADVRYALRAMRRSPGFAIAVAITLGIGIGVNGIVFGFANSLLFRPIAARDAGELVSLFNRDVKSGQPSELGYQDYVDFRDRSGVFAGIAGFTGVPLNLVVPGTSAVGSADMVWAEMVTENYFTVLGQRPAAGRFFTADDAPLGANPFAVISYASWKNRFSGDPAIVGRTVRINGTEFTITGVAAPGFKGLRIFGFWPEVWVPVGMHGIVMPGSSRLLTGRGGGWMMTVARMRPGMDQQHTEAAAIQFARRLETQFPETNRDVSVQVVPAKVGFDNPSFVKSGVLFLASGLGVFASLVTLLIICANLANLQLARAAARAREIAIRLSLGCSRERLTRQLVVESAVFAIPGALIAAALVRLGPALEPLMTPRLQFRVGMNATPDVRVALFSAAVGFLAIVLFGIVPALRASRRSLALSNVIGPSRGNLRQPARLRAVLVVSQLALSVVLLVGGTLFVRSLFVARGMDVGFDARDRALMSVNVGLQGYDEARGRRFYDDVLARVRSLPSTVSATWAFPVPFDTYDRGMSLYVDGAPSRAPDGTYGVDISNVAEDFVGALGLRLQDGREFTTADSVGAPRVMVVSRAFATRFWPGESPVGQRIRRGGASGPEITVIGVVEDAKYFLIGPATPVRAYLPLRQGYRDWETLIVHTRGDPAVVMPQLRRIVSDVDPVLPVFGVTTMEQAVGSGLATSKTAAGISGFFGAFALLIAAVGLYAVVASGVSERTREIGVRMALGSTPRDVMRLVMRGGARLGLIGLVLGLVGAFAVARAMGGILFGLSPGDPVTFAAVPIVLAVVVLAATWLPARRAVQLDPIDALRSD
jgi:predicted permease